MNYKIKNINLAKQGQQSLEWAAREMPVLKIIAEQFKKAQPFKGMRIAACLHITKETGNLLLALKAGGAKVSACASNPLSTQDDIAAALAKAGINIYAIYGQSNKDYYKNLELALEIKPHITIDDGADLISLIHSKHQSLIKNIYGGLEETTTGVIRLKAMAKDGALKYPVVAINDTPTKHMFDNVYGTGQSTMDGLIRATNVLIAGKTVVVAGYGYCGKGVGLRAKGLGAKVIVTEVDPLPALQAHMDGFSVMKMDSASTLGDIFITVTGDKDVLTKKHFAKMKDGAILANSGHFNVEINTKDLKQLSKATKAIKKDVVEYTLKNGKRIYLLAEGRLVNLAAAEGHPSSVMDMSFANQALTSAWLAKNYKKLEAQVYDVPQEIDEKVSRLKLQSLCVTIDTLTLEQKKYLSSWQEGT